METLSYVLVVIGAAATSGAMMQVVSWLERPRKKNKPHSYGNSHAVQRVSR